MLEVRSTLPERMDTDCIDYRDYQRCLRDLSRVNSLTFTHRPTLAWLRRKAERLTSFSLLDVACGYGDGLRRIRRWADLRGLSARLEGIDLNPWAIRAAREATKDGITYRTGDVFALDANETFDFIISSQFTHHLTDDEIVGFIRLMEVHARHGWFISDLHRHWMPYYGFGILAWLARWHPFVLSDGRISISRAFVPADWRKLVREAGLSERGVMISWHIPFRLCVARR